MWLTWRLREATPLRDVSAISPSSMKVTCLQPSKLSALSQMRDMPELFNLNDLL